jgi:hypothetical protein
MPSVTDGAPSRRNCGFRLALIPISQSFLTNLIKFCLFAGGPGGKLSHRR